MTINGMLNSFVEALPIETAPKDGSRIIVGDAQAAQDAIWSEKPFPKWYRYIWRDGGSQGLGFTPAWWMPFPEISKRPRT